MGTQTDVWAVTPSTSATVLRAAASVAGAGALTLLTGNVGTNGTGYKIRITSAGNDSGITFTITGQKVGQLTGVTTEVVTGGNATTADSTNYYATVSSIVASGASAGNVSVGTTGSLAFPRTRIKAVHYVGAANAGSIVFTLNSTSAVLLTIDTEGSATSAHTVDVPGEGVLIGKSAAQDFAVMALTQVSKVTVFCG